MSPLALPLLVCLSAASAETDPAEATRSATDVEVLGRKVLVLSDGTRLEGEVEDTGAGWRLTADTGVTSEVPYEAVSEIADPGSVSPAPAASSNARIIIADRADGGFDDTNLNRYLYAPSAYTLGEGQAYFSQKEFLWSSMAYGITDDLDLQLGSVVPLLAFPATRNLMVGLKQAIDLSDTARLAVGGQVTLLPDIGGAGTPFVNLTLGEEDRHGSFNLGMPMSFGGGGGVQTSGVLLANASYYYRLGPRAAVVAEMWSLMTRYDGSYFLPSGGIRTIGRRFSATIGTYNLVQLDDFTLLPIPWLDFTWRLGASA